MSMLILGDTGSACILNENGLIIGDRNLQNVIDGKNVYDLYPSSKNTKIFDKVLSYQTGSALITMNHIKTMRNMLLFREQTGLCLSIHPKENLCHPYSFPFYCPHYLPYCFWLLQVRLLYRFPRKLELLFQLQQTVYKSWQRDRLKPWCFIKRRLHYRNPG